ncbi:MAG: thiol oxidoreductase, partial [Candidatus Rokuibacteriota bacterium]
IFFLHDGRTTDLLAAIRAHASVGNAFFPPSEANAVIANFNGLPESEKQHVLDFLRGL